MKPDTLKQAVAEAKRFISAAEKCKPRTLVCLNGKTRVYFYPSKETGAAKRASMDLTRKLADLRAGR
jgi:hypothetical protein